MAWDIVTGGAGFIGSNLVDALLARGRRVRVIDNFSTGRRENLAEALAAAGDGRLEIVEGSVTDAALLRRCLSDVDIVYHQAALASVQRSVDDPARTNDHNIGGTLAVLLAARDGGARRVVYAASSSAYGDTPTLPKRETMPTDPLSPYALTKLAGEIYCRQFHQLYGLETVALRYFNVFGPRQNPASQYAAVIPLFISRMLRGEPPIIYGDGRQSRDFSYIDNVVEANLLAAAAPPAACGRVFNIACGVRVDLLAIVELLNRKLGAGLRPVHEPPRRGDVRHSEADITAAHEYLNYQPRVGFEDGLTRTLAWFQAQAAAASR
ncbi:MAG TPA: SDR family oxidoreductase [Acidobacteriota bacterium]|nr:SDR family oxidoreductase [Acidobacteriota bacterium]HQM64445.1 SDR family oxidoreductase [Acidobacteriota bacterium]